MAICCQVGGDSSTAVAGSLLPCGHRDTEDLSLYITDGAGQVEYGAYTAPLGLYDVILARADAPAISIIAPAGRPLSYLSFYLPPFIAPTSN